MCNSCEQSNVFLSVRLIQIQICEKDRKIGECGARYAESLRMCHSLAESTGAWREHAQNDVQMKVENGQFEWIAREKCENGKERFSGEIRTGHCGERGAKSDTNQNEMFRKKTRRRSVLSL